MVETMKSSAEQLYTTQDAIKWTETSSKSKLNDIKWLVKWSNNDQIKHLADLLENKEYKQFQKEIWITWETNLDGKLWQNTLNKTKSYIDKENQLDKVKENTDDKMHDIMNWISDEFKNNTENLNTWIKNISKKRWERWDVSLKKYVKYEEDVWFILTWKKLELKHLYILDYDNLYEEINDTIDNVSITFRWKNIVINDKYVITPAWTMCKYKNKNNIDGWTENEYNTAHRGMVKPLYDYLVNHTSTYEKSYTVVADGSGNHNNHFDTPRQTRKDNTKEDYSDVGMHKEIDKDGNTIWVSDRIRP